MNVSGSGNLAEQVGMATMKMALDQQKVQGANAVALIESAAPQTQAVNASTPAPAASSVVGTNIDVHV